MKIKRSFFKIHGWIGTRLSILFFIVCFSGTLATLSNEMDWLFNPEMRATPREELAPRNEILKNLREEYPTASFTYWMRPDEPYLADIIYLVEDGKRSYVFANRYTGEVQGESQLTIQRFFRDLHYYLFIPFNIGHYTVLLFGFLLLISLITALLFYKKWWRKLFELQTGKGTLVLFRSLHRLVGLWSVPFSILFSITGIWYFLERSDLLTEEVNPGAPRLENTEMAEAQLPLSYTIDYDKAVAIAENSIPGITVGDIIPPENSTSAIYLTGKGEEPLVRQRANRVYLDPLSYEVARVQKAEQISTSMWLNDIADPLHFGNWGGLITKFIWFVFGLGISSLILTGIWITLKRNALKRKKKQKPVMGAWSYVNWGIFLVFIGYMYHRLITGYNLPVSGLVYISLGWIVFLALTYYLFIYRLKKAVFKTG